MADLTSDQIQTLIDGFYNALSSALQSPKPNYTVGGRSVSFADYIQMLNIELQRLMTVKAAIPSESTVNFDSQIDTDGTDNTEYEGDDSVQ